MKPLAIGPAEASESAEGVRRWSGRIGGEELWFEFPAAIAGPDRGEPFVAAALLPAMRAGVPLVGHPDLPVCPEFRANLDRLQRIFHLWGPALGHALDPVPIDVPVAPPPPGRGPGSFFSGGVDGTHTWLEAPEPIRESLFVRGIDFQLDNPVYFESLARNREWLAARGTTLHPAASNIRFVGRHFGFGWNSYFGAGLGALAHVAGFATTYVASGHTWRELWADGSHPASDHLWSSATRRLVHHGRGALRWQKLARLAEEPGALELLRVCWQDKGFNCGRCEKCLRTMVLLRLLRLSSPNFPPLDDLAAVAAFRPSDRSEAVFIEEALALEHQRPDPPLRRALERSLRAHRLRDVLRCLDHGFTGGRVSALRRRLR